MDDIFKLVSVGSLTPEDDFMEKYQPKTEEEQEFKRLVENAITSGLNNFWAPICDPSLDAKGRIFYEPEKEPIVGKLYKWWKKKAKEFCPERNSRLGTDNEYFAYLATEIKALVEDGKPIEWAWQAVGNTAKKIIHKRKFKAFGYGRSNCYKIVAGDEEKGKFFLMCGFYNRCRNYYLKSSIYHVSVKNEICRIGSGWIILTKG